MFPFVVVAWLEVATQGEITVALSLQHWLISRFVSRVRVLGTSQSPVKSCHLETRFELIEGPRDLVSLMWQTRHALIKQVWLILSCSYHFSRQASSLQWWASAASQVEHVFKPQGQSAGKHTDDSAADYAEIIECRSLCRCGTFQSFGMQVGWSYPRRWESSPRVALLSFVASILALRHCSSTNLVIGHVHRTRSAVQHCLRNLSCRKVAVAGKGTYLASRCRSCILWGSAFNLMHLFPAIAHRGSKGDETYVD